MGKIVCQFGVRHGSCRCISDHVKTIVCDVPAAHEHLEPKCEGKWLTQKSAEHVCNKPTDGTGVSVGDIWQCNGCKRQWKVLGLESGTSWNPTNPPYIRWAAHDPDAYGEK